MPRLAIAAIAVVAAAATTAGPARAGAMACHREWPVVAHHAGGAPAAGGALPVACVSETGFATSETTIALTNTGAVFFSPAHTENSMARSRDGGATWDLVYPLKMQYTSLWNTDDPYVTVDRRTGRVFWVHVTGPTRTTPLLVDESPLPGGLATAIAFAYGFQVYSTPDDGRTWTTADYSTAPMTDWEQIFVGPPAAGAPAPTRYPGVVYVCGNSPAEVSGPARLCYRSLDGGATFAPAGVVGPAPDACAALSSNVGAVASDGTVYVPMTCLNGAYVAVSRDEGSSYTFRPITGAPGGSIGGGVQIAVDAADTLYALWLAGDDLNLAASRDQGRSWSRPLSIAAPGVHAIALPRLAAGLAGHVGAVYYAGATTDAQDLTAYATQTTDALDQQPTFTSAVLIDPAHPIFQNYAFNTSPRADYVGAAYDGNGNLWAGVVRQLGKPAADGTVQTTGYVATMRPRPDVRRHRATRRHRRVRPRHPRRRRG